MTKIIIAAVAEDGCLGKGNALPWRFPEDLRMFKRETAGHAIIMGRRTFESIGSKPLPKRTNFVLTRTPRESSDPSLVFIATLNDAFARCAGREKVFVAGGAEIYKLAWPHVDEIWLTQVPGKYECDTYLPNYPLDAAWECYFEERGEQVIFQRHRRRITST